MTYRDRKSHEQVISASQPLRRNEKAQEPQRHVGSGKRPRALQRKRGDGEIYDVIDEWLAPVLARRIASQFSQPRPGLEKQKKTNV